MLVLNITLPAMQHTSAGQIVSRHTLSYSAVEIVFLSAGANYERVERIISKRIDIVMYSC